MAHQVIKYRLTAEGTIPEFVCSSNESIGGSFGVNDGLEDSPRDWLMVEISEDGATGDFEVINSQEDLKSYLDSISSGWIMPDPDNEGLNVAFNSTSQAASVWEKLDNLNA